jgi:CubicO group peptidase (beta-lactamase class C family)
MNKTLFIIPVIIVLISCNQKKASQKKLTVEMDRDSITNELIEIHKQGYINGFSVAIVNEHEVLYKAGIGYSNVDSKTKYTENTIQNIGSVSKTFIGVALLKAQELGKLRLDDSINNYLPFQVYNPNHPTEEIRLRHLATHTSTILDTDYYNEKSYVLKENLEVSESLRTLSETFNPPASKMPLIPFLEKLLSEKGEWYKEQGFLQNKPGDIFEYSNIGATLAAAVLEIATGKSFNEFVTEHILKPLNMNSSGWSFDDVELSKHSTLYATPDTELPYYSLITYPDGGLISSISDMAQYLIELIKGYSGNGTLLNKASYKELFKEQLTSASFPDRDADDDYDDEFNTGIFMGFTPKGYIGHTGGDPGIAVYMFFKPKSKTGKILMINTSVRDVNGEDEFFAIWNTLDKYEHRINTN